jgi:hypothetical protein
MISLYILFYFYENHHNLVHPEATDNFDSRSHFAMNISKSTDDKKSPQAQNKQDKRAAALRDNLRKRKALKKQQDTQKP